MNAKLIVKNFGPIKEAALDLRRYTLFIGTQASGKSTLAKLIAIFKDLEFINGADYVKKFTDYNIINFFSEKTYFHFSNESYTIVFENKKFSIEKSQAYIEKLSNDRKRIDKILDDFIKTQAKALEIQDKDSYKIQLYNSNWKFLSFIPIEQTYIPAERMLLSLVAENPFTSFKDFSLPSCIISFGRKFEQAKRAFPTFPVDFLNITFKSEDTKQKVYYDDSHSLDLSECASGFQAIIPILLVVRALSKSIPSGSFIIEEPELNLFPTTQKQLIDFIVGELNSSPVSGELTITSHSPYVLSTLNILLLAFIAARKNPENIQEISARVPKNTWINPDDFNAFHFSKGNVKEIFDRKVNLISQNELDDISDDIGGTFDMLLNKYQEA